MSKLKISDADYAELAKAFSKLNLAERYHKYEIAGLTPMQFRWDMLYELNYPTTPLYDYLNDNHIDSALKRIVYEAIRT